MAQKMFKACQIPTSVKTTGLVFIRRFFHTYLVIIPTGYNLACICSWHSRSCQLDAMVVSLLLRFSVCRYIFLTRHARTSENYSTNDTKFRRFLLAIFKLDNYLPSGQKHIFVMTSEMNLL